MNKGCCHSLRTVRSDRCRQAMTRKDLMLLKEMRKGEEVTPPYAYREER